MFESSSAQLPEEEPDVVRETARLAAEQRFEEAIKLVDEVLQERPASDSLHELRSKLVRAEQSRAGEAEETSTIISAATRMIEAKQTREAIDLLFHAVQRHPYAKQLQLLLAKALEGESREYYNVPARCTDEDRIDAEVLDYDAIKRLFNRASG